MTRSPQENIKLLRDGGLTQNQIAELLQVSQPLVCRWEKGRIPDSADIAHRLSVLAEEHASRNSA